MRTLIVLGATGTMGRRVVELALRTLPGVEVVAASRSGEDVAGVRGRAVSVEDFASLARETPGTARAVVNAVGPYDYDPARLVTACVEAGIHYTDLAEEPTFLAAAARAAETAGAAERGVVVVPGASTVPGLVQLLARTWAKRDDVAEVRAWLSLGSRNPVGEGLLVGLLRPLGRPTADGTLAFERSVARTAATGKVLRYGRYPTGFAADRLRLGDRRVPVRFLVGFDRAPIVSALVATAPVLARLSDAELRRLARAALPAVRALSRLGTRRGSLVLEARDAEGRVLDTLEVVAEREGLGVPASPPLWVVRKLREGPPPRAGALALDDVVSFDEAVAWLHEAGYAVCGSGERAPTIPLRPETL